MIEEEIIEVPKKEKKKIEADEILEQDKKQKEKLDAVDEKLKKLIDNPDIEI